MLSIMENLIEIEIDAEQAETLLRADFIVEQEEYNDQTGEYTPLPGLYELTAAIWDDRQGEYSWETLDEAEAAIRWMLDLAK